MVPDNIGDRPIGFAPQIDRRFRRAARDIAMLSEGLLESGDAPLLALAVPSDGWGDRLPLLLWTQRLESAADRTRALCDIAMFAPAIDALCLAADDLYDCLRAARICPAGTRGLSVVTDGTGIALTADTPDADTADAGWLLSLAGRDGRAVTILPLAGDGIWPLLEAEADGCSLH